MTSLNNDAQGKQQFKAKVGHLMQSYELSKQEELLKKQQIKQNIMLQIMNNRFKPTPSSSDPQNKSQTSKTANSDPQILQYPLQQDIPLVTFHPNENRTNPGTSVNSVPGIKANESRKEQIQQFHPQESSFNMRKRNKSLEDEIIYKPQFQINNRARQQPDSDEELKKSVSRIAKYANKYFPNDFKQKVPEIKQETNEFLEVDRQVRLTAAKNESKDNYFWPSSIQKSRKQEYPPSNEKGAEEIQIQQEQKQQDNHEGVFLTMEESQSMTASEIPKNVAFQIKMDKSTDPDHIQQLRKQKIKQMEKKRQERILQFRRNQAQKKVQMPRGRSSHAIKHEKYEKEQLIESQMPPKSTTIERKSNLQRPPKMENKSERELNKHQPIPLDSYELQYQLKQSKASKFNKIETVEKVQKQSFMQIEQPNCKVISPVRTPKTIMSQHKSKSIQKSSNIFVSQSQIPREKSANKISEPKIEPKQRKYSFSRQSNKKLMINAITYVCFPGELNRKERERLIQTLETSEYEFFVFLFKEYSRKIIKAIYTLDNSQTKLQKIYGEKGPTDITADQVQEFYRFDSGSRQFKKVDGCRSFSFVIHAIDLR